MIFALIAFIILLLLQIPISFVLGITTFFYIFLSANFGLLDATPQRLFSGLESYGLLAIPMFMLAGELMNSGGITSRLVNFSKTMVGHFRGGLAYVNVVSNVLLASIIGSATAQIAMMSKIMVPSMEKEGYSKEFATATTASAGILGPIIPPSMMFIIYGVTSGTSIGDMFLGGVFPGILITFLFIVLIGYFGTKHQWPTLTRSTVSQMFKSFISVIPALLVPIIIIVGILTGIFTATEAASIACIIALFVGGFLYKEIKLKSIPRILINTAITTATITMLIAMANIFGWVLAFERIPQQIATWMTSLTDNALIFLIIVNIFLLIVGMFLDGIAALIILVPIFMPLIINYNIDPVHFGVIICINLTIGLLTPPVGTGLFIASSLTNIKLERLVRAIWPFLLASIVALFIISYAPQIVTWLPSIFN
ncbi:TRAP transporter large permease [Caldibacillus thermolactis]|jgi:tripartite ATP-independent transporter DctM subunit|uniref:TRAP transporter large permease n=1 Tax=Pallidibacillus thermolactis TaxID=251051 RepID=A0ABT2WFN3_9BACI|nr:TRAP transporter large permease [Pallidibacillus thermolactis]MCU9594504.1 TRAP transporter large permease [Pallidibacillus thermolactis]MCU9600975.1 TRAP transporter large permease [Pallidibacillus thermolactis subsp. kokeshiiformis]